MNLCYFTLRRLTAELDGALRNRQILDASIDPPHDLRLDLAGGMGLLLSASPEMPRIALSPYAPSGQSIRPAWVQQHLLRARIESVSQAPYERIVEIAVAKRDRLGGIARHCLIAELVGNHSNVVFVSERQDRVLGTVRLAGRRTTRHNRIQPGNRYQPPPPQDRFRPPDLTAAVIQKALASTDAAPHTTLARTVAGLDPFSARGLLDRVGMPASGRPDPDTFEKLCLEVQALFSDPPFLDGAVITDSPGGGRCEVHVLDLGNPPIEVHEPYPSVSAAIEAASRREGESRAFVRGFGKLEKALKDRSDSLETKAVRIEEDLRDAGRADQYERFGSLLMANLQKVEPGAPSVTLPDLFDAQAPAVTIPLDPHRQPVENARNYLKRCGKLRKAAPILARRLDALRGELDAVGAYRERLEGSTSGPELAVLSEQLDGAGLLRPRATGRPGSRAERKGHPIRPRRYATSDGWTVLVGRNNQENDRLTKASAKDDIFFHAHGCAGSHVILKRYGRAGPPPSKALEEAACLAAYWSKARGSRTVPVSYTEVRYVKKPRNAPPGLVTIQKEKTLFVSPSEIERQGNETQEQES